MTSFLEITLPPGTEDHTEAIEKALRRAGKAPKSVWRLVKKSIDARHKPVVYRMRFEIRPAGSDTTSDLPKLSARNVSTKPEVYIAGSGPCGLFAALALIENNLKPIILERGKDVRARRRDLAALNREEIVNPESNYCFGEGGAGTYSDGKLYTRSKKRGSVEKILNYLVAFGAPENILTDAHPHIGTNKLPVLITAIREYIVACGGEVRFETKLTDIGVTNGKISSITLNGDEKTPCKHLILATGHSARDIFELLYRRKIRIEAKPFALGVRVEHPQDIIDRIQYKMDSRGAHLPPASYSLVHQVDNRGVYSFCMCPGGIIAPCATAPGEVVTNGWSPSKRNNPYANSGIVVAVEAENFDPDDTGNPLKALAYQSRVEQSAWKLGGGLQIAPAQRLVDFSEGRLSNDLPACSYQPGLRSSELSECLPVEIHTRLQKAFQIFGKKMHGYYTNEAVVVATESRTSSPVRIPRGTDMQHTEISGLFPAGEGAGYAGGIVSAAIDGQKSAEGVAALFQK